MSSEKWTIKMTISKFKLCGNEMSTNLVPKIYFEWFLNTMESRS